MVIGNDARIMTIPLELEDEFLGMTLFEAFSIEKANDGQSIKGLYPLTDTSIKVMFEKWKKDKV